VNLVNLCKTAQSHARLRKTLDSMAKMQCSIYSWTYEWLNHKIWKLTRYKFNEFIDMLTSQSYNENPIYMISHASNSFFSFTYVQEPLQYWTKWKCSTSTHCTHTKHTRPNTKFSYYGKAIVSSSIIVKQCNRQTLGINVYTIYWRSVNWYQFRHEFRHVRIDLTISTFNVHTAH